MTEDGLSLPVGWVWLTPRHEDCVRFGSKAADRAGAMSWPPRQDEIDGAVKKVTAP